MNNNSLKIFDSNKYLFDEIEDIVVPLSFEILKLKKNLSYYWRIPEKFEENDYLINRELWIRKF